MPLYEYECTACKRRFELIQKVSDPPAQTCPTCGGAVHKLQSAPAFQFKGTGWYVTDYARKNQSSADRAESGSGSTATDGKGGEPKGGEKGKEAGDKSSNSSKGAAAGSSSSSSTSAASSSKE